jgi:ribonuclease D
MIAGKYMRVEHNELPRRRIMEKLAVFAGAGCKFTNRGKLRGQRVVQRGKSHSTASMLSFARIASNIHAASLPRRIKEWMRQSP